MRHFKRTVLITAAASLLVAPALADDGDKAQTRERTQVTAEQRQQAMEERRQAVHSLPAEQRAAVREAHRKARANEYDGTQRRMAQHAHRHDRAAGGSRGAGKG